MITELPAKLIASLLSLQACGFVCVSMYIYNVIYILVLYI